MTLAFTVLGTPEPQGSLKAYTPKGRTFPVLTSDNADLKPWRQQVGTVALLAARAAGFAVSSEAIDLEIGFYFARPRSASKRLLHKITRPDADKLCRAVLDALKGIVYRDDSQVVALECTKNFGIPERAEIALVTLGIKSPPLMRAGATKGTKNSPARPLGNEPRRGRRSTV